MKEYEGITNSKYKIRPISERYFVNMINSKDAVGLDIVCFILLSKPNYITFHKANSIYKISIVKTMTVIRTCTAVSLQ